MRLMECTESAAEERVAAAVIVAATEVPINVRRFMRCILPLWERKGTGFKEKKKGGPTGSDRPPELEASEEQPQAELHAALRVGSAGMQEVGRGYAAWVAGIAADRDCAAIHAAVNAVVLRVVEQVEVLPAEIETACFGEGEALEKAEVEIDAAGTVQSVASHVTEGQAGWNGVRCGVEHQRTADPRD